MCVRRKRHSSWKAALLGALALTASACAAPAEPAPNLPAERVNVCHARVVITFAQSVGDRPADDFVTEISRAANVALSFVRAAGPGLYVFQFDADDSDESCSQALARLRRDERVRSVDLDQRRHVLE